MTNFNTSLLEIADIHPLFHEQDGDTDITGDYICAKHYGKIYVLLRKGGSEDVDTGSIAFLQASDASGTGAKALNCRKCWYKLGTMTSQGTWTAVNVGSGTPDDSLAFGSSATAGSTLVTSSDVNTSAFLLLCELLPEDFDVANGFDFFTAFMEGDEVNNACKYTADAILLHSKYGQSVPLTAIA